MIPKIIHACWFGGKPLPKVYSQYIDGWKRLHPSWEVKIWTEKEFETYLGTSSFVNYCINKQKWGFLADYFRLVVLYKFGGVYCDTDVEMFKPLDCFLDNKIFMCFIFDDLIGTATIGSEPKNPIIKAWLDQIVTDFEKNKKLEVSNQWITQFFLDNFEDFKLNGKEQHLKSGMSIYPRDYFEKITMSNKSRWGMLYTIVGVVGWIIRDPYILELQKKFYRKGLLHILVIKNV